MYRATVNQQRTNTPFQLYLLRLRAVLNVTCILQRPWILPHFIMSKVVFKKDSESK